MKQLKITRQITDRECTSLDIYLKDIARLNLITADEEVSLAQRIKEGDMSALEKLVESNLRFVVSVSKQYQNQGLTLQDLINEGNFGLMKAAKGYDETRGFKFISYSVWWIRQSILQALAEQARLVRLPLNKIGNLSKIKKATTLLEQKLERQPDTEEISTFLGMSEHEVDAAIKSNGTQTSFDSPLSNDDDMNLYDVIPSTDESNSPEGNLYIKSLRHDIERALSTLSPREAKVIRLFFGLGTEHPLTLKEISEKMNLSCERIRQIKNIAIRKLKNTSRSKLLKTYLG